MSAAKTVLLSLCPLCGKTPFIQGPKSRPGGGYAIRCNGRNHHVMVDAVRLETAAGRWNNQSVYLGHVKVTAP